MRALPNNVLVVGGGVAGMSAAICLLARGAKVTLIDKDPNWSVYGAGITCSGVTYRALHDLGFGDVLATTGATFNDLRMHALDSGALIRTVDLPRMAGPDNPAGGGIMRPDLHRIMSRKVTAMGADVRLGVTVTGLIQDEDGVDLTFSDATQARFDMVIGADGLFSTLRGMLFPDAPQPRFTGQACWRVMFDMPPEWEGSGVMFMSPRMKVGFTPCAPGRMYMYLLEHVPDNPRRTEVELPARIGTLLSGITGKIAELRDTIAADTAINYRPLEALLLPGDWYLGRVILIGDAAHATTPHLASGAGLAMEDALALAEELEGRDSLAAAFASFMARRGPRAREIVEVSLKLGELEMAGAPMPEQADLMQKASMMAAAPY